MKKSTLILLVGAIVGIFTYRYFLKGKTPAAKSYYTGDVSETKDIIVKYTGPDLSYTGLVTQSGDTIRATLMTDGTLRYGMAGNGIIASSHTFIIPEGNYIILMSTPKTPEI